MKLAIMQPYFLPYIGYFQLMAAVDRFVILDDVNFMKGGWLNRNQIMSFGKTQWLTIPLSGASPNKLICEIDHQINEKFIKKTLRSLEGAYQKAPHFQQGMEVFQELINHKTTNLAEFVRHSLFTVCEYLGIQCEIIPSSKPYNNSQLNGEERVLDICEQESASVYINLPGGRAIYQSEKFEQRGIKLSFIEPQLKEYGENFTPRLSILDVIMHNSQATSSEMANDTLVLA